MLDAFRFAVTQEPSARSTRTTGWLVGSIAAVVLIAAVVTGAFVLLADGRSQRFDSATDDAATSSVPDSSGSDVETDVEGIAVVPGEQGATAPAQASSGSGAPPPPPPPPPTLPDGAEVGESVRVIDGRTWALGDSARRSSNSGISWVPLGREDDRLTVANHQASQVFGVEGAVYEENRFAVLVEIAWRDVQPEPGVFDWEAADAIFAEIDNNAEPGVGVFIWPQVYGEWLPDWLGASSGIDFAADPREVWRATSDDGTFLISEDLGTFIDALVSRYGTRPDLVHVDMRLPFDDRNGEWVARDRTRNEADDLEIAAFTRRYQQQWIDAFDENGVDRSKLVSVVARTDYGGEQILIDGYEAGVGQREGVPERQQVWFSAYGNYIDEDGFLSVDPIAPGQASDAIRYSEATEYSLIEDTFGSTEYTVQRFRGALLWAIHAGRNWLSFPNGFLSPLDRFPNTSLAPAEQAELAEIHEMIRWAQLSLGHVPETSNDAWVWLRETNYTALNYNLLTDADRQDETTAQNLGRWLRQVETEGHFTVPTSQTAVEEHFSLRAAGIECSDVLCEDFAAQRTNAESGDTAILFDLLPGFRSSDPGIATVIVAVDDQQAASVALEYSNGEEVLTTAPATLDGAGGTRTVLFQVPDLAADDSVLGADFRLVTATGDVTVDLVRVVSDVVLAEAG